MVILSNVVWKPIRTFIDTARITVRGGRGGNGLPKYGGVGGKGGDVYIEGNSEYSLLKLIKEFPARKFVGGPGANSKRFCILGSPGQDVIIPCPTGVAAIVESKFVGEVNAHGERLLLAKGGSGGGPQNGYLGQKGQVFPLTLDLKLIADVGFVGFPNAGKSSLLKAISKAQPKIASYPFTTIQPKVGMVEYNDFRKISVADLPGLIEGAHMNYGMGHRFLKHCLRTKILLFVVDIDGFRLNAMASHRDAFETIVFLNKELELYNEELLNKPSILAVNKSDNDPDLSKYNSLRNMLRDMKSNSGHIPNEMLPSSFMKFDAILPISAKHGANISVLKEKIRTIIDISEEEKRKETEICHLRNAVPDVIYV
ncbi:GTP-binding protein 10-like [Uloborus diversus]|uniref:GTP-binding protein 10-like n=1 Tax=Uloborus diversus TaxID=327109 RepID=UPI00240A1D37|nr:GTP-binding protein 10-like [Uloborus diversus]